MTLLPRGAQIGHLPIQRKSRYFLMQDFARFDTLSLLWTLTNNTSVLGRFQVKSDSQAPLLTVTFKVIPKAARYPLLNVKLKCFHKLPIILTNIWRARSLLS